MQKENCSSEMIAVLVMQISNNLVTCVRCGKVCVAVFTSSDLESLMSSRTLESITCLRAELLLPANVFLQIISFYFSGFLALFM